MTHITVDQALLDKALLGAALGDPETWATWMTALKAAFGIELNREERRAFASIAGSRKPPEKRLEEFWCVVGRGGGKSKMAAAIGVYIACFLEHRLSPGEQGFVLVLAASKDQAGIVYRYALAFIQRSSILRQMIVNVTASEIRLNNGVTLATHPNSFRSIRGRSLLACVFDEVALWRDEESALPDVECFRAVKPSLVRCNGMLIGISTPYRKTGLLYNKYKRHFGTDDDSVLVVKGGTSVFNPTIDQEKIVRELTDDPEGNRSEWLAEFRVDRSALLDEQVILDAIDYSRPLELPPRSDLKYHCYVDSSAGRHDAFTCVIGHCEGKKPDLSWTADVVRGRHPPFDARAVSAEYVGLARQYGVTKIVGDAFAGEWVAQSFRDAGARYETSRLHASPTYLEGVAYFNRGAVNIPDFDPLTRELRTLERRVQRSGRDAVDHPRNGSDDYANALFGALYISMHEAHRPKSWVGAVDVNGQIHYLPKNNPHMEPRQPLRFVNVDENGNILTPEQAQAVARGDRLKARR